MAAKGNAERIRRGFMTLFFMLTMLASLLTMSAPVLVAFGDVVVSLGLASRFACAMCYGLKEHVVRYGFRSSLMDIPLVSIIRSVLCTCVYYLCDGPGLSHGPYLGAVTICSISSVVILAVKACLFTPVVDFESETSPSFTRNKLHLKKSLGMSVLFLSSLVFAFGHIIVAYRTTCKTRRKLLLYNVDPESILSCKNMFFGFPKIPRSPTPCSGKTSKSDTEKKRKALLCDVSDLPISLLADTDSMFIACQGLSVHYKILSSESPTSRVLALSPFHEHSHFYSPPVVPSARHKLERPLTIESKTHVYIDTSSSYQFENSSLYAPLLANFNIPSASLSDEMPVLDLDEANRGGCLFDPDSVCADMTDKRKFAVVLIHGFGGGVFSWRHVMGVLARLIGCPVVAFDRPGWGLTSRPRRKDWEERKLPNPYMLEAQVDLLISFCKSMGFASVVLVGHDDGGLLALKTAEKLRASADSASVEIKGVVLLSVSLSREVVPAFTRILLHTPLGKKHVVRPLLRTEITQVINRRAWFDSTKLTTEVLNLYKAPLFVEGWDEALHEIVRLSFGMVLSPSDASSLLESLAVVPVLVVAGAEDALVPLKSTQAMATKLANSRLVAISGCGHLPHEECPKALLSALSPFISRLIPVHDAL